MFPLSMKRDSSKFSSLALSAFLLGALGAPAGAEAATFTVTNANDSGAGSLREAIDDADANGGSDTIEFAIPGPEPHVIALGSQLKIDDPVVLDATTQPGYGGTPVVILDGSGLASNQNGLRLTGGSITIRGLMIRDCPRNGVRIDTAGGNVLTGNYIGTDGSSDQGNGSDGILIVGQSNNRIGGTTATERNVISGNDANGIRITDGGTGNQIRGNYIGTDAGGTSAIGNGSGSGSGVFIDDGSGNTIGGSTAGHRNVISGNADGNGVLLSGATATGNTVQGNYIGTDAAGTAAVANGDGGVNLSGATNNSILDNVLSGNGPGGIGAGIKIQFSATGNVVQGNVVGLNAAGGAAVPNFRGVLIVEAGGNTVGGASAGDRNVISGNDSSGIVIQGSGASTNVIEGNYIGLDSTGAAALGNQGEGINVSGMAGLPVSDNEILDNVVSGSTANGIHVHDGPDGTRIQGNFVGTNAAGNVARPNASNGIKIADAGGTLVGGAGLGNLVSGNGTNGILLDFVSGTVVRGNMVGTEADGVSPLGNGQRGLRVTNGSSGNTVGGTGDGQGNTVAYNDSDGIEVDSGSFNAIRGNSFFSNGDLGIDLGPGGPTANDGPFDSDSGPNDLQNFPVLTSAVLGDGGITVDGTLESVQSTEFDLDFYSSPACDPSGHGEGTVYLGSAQVSTDGAGVVAFSVAVDPASPGSWLTATATDPNGNTSELSTCEEIACGPACVFADGFESGDLSAWSSSVP